MAQIFPLSQLTDRLHRIEEEVRALREDLESHREAPASQPGAPHLPRVEKTVLRKWAADLFRDLAIEDRPIGALEAQEMSKGSGLEPNELSRSLIQARDE